MSKQILSILIMILCSTVFLYGCGTETTSQTDETLQTDCNSGTYDGTSDEIEFQLPPPSANAIDSYIVELEDSVTHETLGSQEGFPGETLIFCIDTPKVYVNATLTALDAGGSVLDIVKVAVVDVDVRNPICQVTVDTAVFMDADHTKVDVDVECVGRQFADVDVDVDVDTRNK